MLAAGWVLLTASRVMAAGSRPAARAALSSLSRTRLVLAVIFVIYLGRLPVGAVENAQRQQAGLADGYHGVTGVQCQAGVVRPSSVGGTAADDPYRWRHPAHQPAADGAQGSPQFDLRDHECQAAPGLRGVPGDGLFL